MLTHIAEKIKKTVEPEANEYMQKYIKTKQTTYCMLCEGYGHLPNHCGTKKRIDAITKGSGMRQYWGAYKSQQKIDFMGDKSDIAQELRVAEQKRLLDDAALTCVVEQKPRPKTPKGTNKMVTEEAPNN